MRPNPATLAVYLIAAAVYIGIGLYNTNFLLSWPVAVAYLLVAVWLVPAAIKRLR